MSVSRSGRTIVLLPDGPFDAGFDDDHVAAYDGMRTAELVAAAHRFERCHPEPRPGGLH